MIFVWPVCVYILYLLFAEGWKNACKGGACWKIRSRDVFCPWLARMFQPHHPPPIYILSLSSFVTFIFVSRSIYTEGICLFIAQRKNNMQTLSSLNPLLFFFSLVTFIQATRALLIWRFPRAANFVFSYHEDGKQHTRDLLVDWRFHYNSEAHKTHCTGCSCLSFICNFLKLLSLYCKKYCRGCTSTICLFDK